MRSGKLATPYRMAGDGRARARRWRSRRLVADLRPSPSPQLTGEALAAMLRPGNAGSNTADDHIDVFEAALWHQIASF